MKKLNLIIVLLLVMASCKKDLQPIRDTVNNGVGQDQPASLICGTDHSGNVPDAIRQQLLRVSAQVDSLVIYMDFNGEVIRPGNTFTAGVTASFLVSSFFFCPAPALTAEDIVEIIRLVQDDFSPFKIKFTTDRAVYDATSPGRRMSCVFSTFPSVLGQPSNVQGVAFFTGNLVTNQPCFVFASAITAFYGEDIDNRVIAATASQELGHLIGLRHQGVYSETCIFQAEYHPGFGSGPLSFGPIMGAANKRITNWFAQPCSSQNDFAFISAVVPLKPDDFPNEPSNRIAEASRTITGVLEESNDVDFIYIRPGIPTAVHVTSENIDLQVSVYNAGGGLIKTYQDPDDTGVFIPQVLGACFLKVEAVNNAFMSSVFMTGTYNLSY